jgi:cytochrome c biogenesis protein CcdA/thiol-disulfide isomerase/thioredoxin
MSLIIIGLLGGLITGISPCILPVLPVIFLTGGAQSAHFDTADGVPPASRWRPYLVIIGLVTSFTVVTLIGSLLLATLHLPQDVVRWVGIGVLVLIGVGLLAPQFERLLERPFQRLARRSEVSNRGSGLGVGFALGAVFVPCAGPVLAAIIVAGSTGRIGADTVLLTLSFAIGVAVPLLAFALAGRGLVERIRAFRTHERGMRIAAGVAMIGLAVGLAFNAPQALQQLVPDYTQQLQQKLTDNPDAQRALNLGGIVTKENKDLSRCTNGSPTLQSCGIAPAFTGITRWLDTPNSAPVELSALRGKVVLVDFWAYSCINCRRSVPHVVAWDKAYRADGLEVIGIHSPEYAFEKDAANVAAGAKGLGITYPVGLDDDLSTWTTYRNRYWPAHYLIDAQGVVRQIVFGEGDYATTEKLIRQLLTTANPDVRLPATTEVADDTPSAGSTTRETYLGFAKDVNFAGPGVYPQGTSTFAVPHRQADDSFALAGSWTIAAQDATPAASRATIRLRFHASLVRMVLSGQGTVTVRLDGGPPTRIRVSGTPNSYPVAAHVGAGQHTLEVDVDRGVHAYSLTFG